MELTYGEFGNIDTSTALLGAGSDLGVKSADERMQHLGVNETRRRHLVLKKMYGRTPYNPSH